MKYDEILNLIASAAILALVLSKSVGTVIPLIILIPVIYLIVDIIKNGNREKNNLEFIYRKIGEKMMYTIIIIVVIFLIVNLPGYVRKHLMQQLADESGKAADGIQVSQLNLLSKIEWLRFYPLKKFFLGLLWCVCYI